MMGWFLVFIAGVLEVIWMVAMKYSDGFTRVVPTIITLVTSLMSFLLLSQALKTLPVGSAYAVWTGIGALGTAVAGILLFQENVTTMRLVSIALVIAGIIGLRLSS